MTSGGKPRVLLVDDSEPTNALMTAILRGDFDVEVATDGAEAIRKLASERYESVLLDLRMPNTDGFAVLEFLKNDGTLVNRVIIVTASLSQKELERVRPFPVFAIVPKPFEIDALLNTVKSCVARVSNGLGSIVSSGVAILVADFIRRRWI